MRLHRLSVPYCNSPRHPAEDPNRRAVHQRTHNPSLWYLRTPKSKSFCPFAPWCYCASQRIQYIS